MLMHYDSLTHYLRDFAYWLALIFFVRWIMQPMSPRRCKWHLRRSANLSEAACGHKTELVVGPYDFDGLPPSARCARCKLTWDMMLNADNAAAKANLPTPHVSWLPHDYFEVSWLTDDYFDEVAKLQARESALG
jgi:hypothetical protein